MLTLRGSSQFLEKEVIYFILQKVCYFILCEYLSQIRVIIMDEHNAYWFLQDTVILYCIAMVLK